MGAASSSRRDRGVDPGTSHAAPESGFQSPTSKSSRPSQAQQIGPNAYGLIGLQNLGNTCFMNSALQCLSNTPPLIDFFRGDAWREELNAENVLGHQGQVATAFAELMREMWDLVQEQVHGPAAGSEGCFTGCCGRRSRRDSSGSGVTKITDAPQAAKLDGTWNAHTAQAAAGKQNDRRTSRKGYISPKSFKKVLGRHCELFSGYQQHDAQELLMFLLDALHEDLNRIVKKPYIECFDYDGEYLSYESAQKTGAEPQKKSEAQAAQLSWIGHLQRNQSVIVDLFQGHLRSELQCAKCGFKSVKFDAFMNLELPLIQGSAPSANGRPATPSQYVDTDINSCLREFTKKEHLTGEHKWRCPKCKKLRDATKQLTLYSLPNVLIITFKRFQVDAFGQSMGKIETHVDFSLKGFDVSEGMSRDPAGNFSADTKDDDDNDPMYDLYGVANHFGGLGGGHYTAFAQNKQDQHWYCFDDSSVTRKKPADICTAAAYVMFFKKRKMQGKLGSALEESPAKIAPDGTKRKGSMHVKQRASVKDRLSSWPVQSLKDKRQLESHRELEPEGM